MKKFLALFLAVIMCLSVMASCNKDDGETNPPATNNQTPSESTPEDTPGDTVASTPEGTTESTPESTPEGSTPESTPNQPTEEYDLAAAAEYVDSLYKKGNTVTAADYQVVGQVMIAGVKYMVTWTVDNELVKTVEGSPYWTIDVDEKAKEEHSYKLTATITAGDGTTATVSYDRTVPKYALTSFEEYMAAEEGTTVVIEGIVVAMNAKSLGNTRNHLFLADAEGKGGYYCYQLDNDPVEAGVKIGMTVSVTAVVTPYSGMQETKGGTFTIVDETIKTVEPLDITDKYAANESLKNYVGLPVVIKGVTIGSQDLATATSQYLYFELNGVKAYVRSYVTDFPTTLTINKDANGSVSSPDKDAMDKDHADHFGYTADVTGILILYNGAPYLIPVSVTPFTNYKLNEKTPAEKIEAELGELKLDASVNSDKVIDLLATGKYYDDVVFTWTTDATAETATIADGKLTLVVPDKELVIKVTVTATCGDVSDTKEFSIKLSKVITTLTDAAAIGAAKDHNTYTDEKYLIAGIVKEVYQTTYGNMYIVDEFGNQFTVYGTFGADGQVRYDKLENKPVAGDYVVILGVLGQYNGTAQMKNGWIQSFTTPITIPEANETVKDFEKNQYTDNKYVISGEITEVQNEKYGNVVITDKDGNSILIYGLYSANGAIRYDKMETKPAKGDTITVVGIIGKYDAPQMKNGWLIGFTEGTASDPVTPGPAPVEPDKLEDGRYSYTLNAGKDALAVDGVMDEAYENGLVWKAIYNLPTEEEYAATIYMAADANYVYVLYVIKDALIVGQAEASKDYRADCADFILSTEAKDTIGTGSDMRIFGNVEGAKGTAAATGVFAAVTELFVKHTEIGYNVEFKIDRSQFTDSSKFSFLAMTGACRTKKSETGDTSTTVYPCIENGAAMGGNDAKGKLNQVVIFDTITEEPDTPSEGGTLTVEQALKLEKGASVVVEGTVVSIDTAWSDQYKNITVTIADDNGNKLQLYRLATLVEKGDVIKVTGTMDEYNGIKQIAAGATAEIISKVTVEGPQSMTVAEALKAADGTTVVVTGTVASIVTAWSDQYKNITINLKGEDGSLLYIYRLGTNVNVGDVITVTGDMATYSNSRQIGQGATAVIVTAHTCTTFSEANCTDPKTCTVCGKTEGNALGHGTLNAEGKCPVCGQIPTVESEFSIAASKGTLADKTITWQANGFTVVGEQAKSTTAIRTSDSDHYRVYKSSTLAIKGTGITQVVITAQNADYAKVLGESLTTAGATATVDGNVVTVTVNEGTVAEILFTATAQTRITKIVVTYVAG